MLRAYSKSEGTGKRKATSAAVSARAYAAGLLATFGVAVPDTLSIDASATDPHPALAAAAAGLTALTGHTDGPPVSPPGRLATCANGAVAAVAALASADADLRTLDGAALLGERAAVFGRGRRGTTSVGGHCRLVRARDGWLAVNLPRPDDLATVPAWLECIVAADPWDTIAEVARDRAASALVARARLLGLAAAEATPADEKAPPWCRIAARGRRVAAPGPRPPLVLDLSTLWAGPLASHLLQLAGARGVTVESTTRPDGARRGPTQFFDLLHAGKESVALDFTSPTGRRALVSLVARADIVVESARPRAMHQLGIDPAALVRARPGLTWISITGYGRRGHAAKWIGFGDDAATAAGLAHATGSLAGAETPLFCADAVADPLTGMHAAAAALAAYRQGGGVLLALALRDVAAHALAFGPTPPAAELRTVTDENGAAAWEVVAAGATARVLPPRARPSQGSARSLGADTDALLRALHG
jgi:crotonobetainyl-CoA:carnitine CoA-transferase CaiB-like acyl-CoA transferase